MSKRVSLALHAIVSDDGTRCAAECPHRTPPVWPLWHCQRFGTLDAENVPRRAAACIAAEQAAASAELALLLSAESEWIEQEAKRSAYLQGVEQAAASVPSCEPRMPPWKGDPATHVAVLRTLRYEQTSPSYGWRKPVLDALDWAIAQLEVKP